MRERTYVVIDLKSFYASVECVERGLDPMNTNLVVADASRTDKTICLAVSPSLKAYGISGRARLFEVKQKLKEVNGRHRWALPQKRFTGASWIDSELKANPRLEIDYIAAVPRMALYIEYSTRIYDIYLKYIAPEDIHVYSIDEVFLDVTNYLDTYRMSAYQLTEKIIYQVLMETGITAAAGIGTNMYLAKVAMDIVAKHVRPDSHGVRIAQLDETEYRRLLWNHRPLTDFWRVGKGYKNRLEKLGLYTMGDIARQSLVDEDVLYRTFGINAELLIDHAWGWEPVTIADIKSYKPQAKSIGSGQVLHSPYTFAKGRVVLHEMADALVYDLIEKKLVTDQLVLTVGYDIENITEGYSGEIVTDSYGREKPKHAHGTVNLDRKTSSAKIITEAVLSLYDSIVDRQLLIRRFNLVAAKVESEAVLAKENAVVQLDLFGERNVRAEKRKAEDKRAEKEKRLQQAVLGLKKKYGKNAVLKGMNYQDGATMMDRNGQIGGHKA